MGIVDYRMDLFKKEPAFVFSLFCLNLNTNQKPVKQRQLIQKTRKAGLFITFMFQRYFSSFLIPIKELSS